eukprot:PhF_6_TR6092/c0_g1_i4/m.8926
MGCAPSAQSRWRHVVSESKKKENYLADHFPLSHHQTLKPSSNLRKTNNGKHSPAVSLTYANVTATFIVDEDMDPNPRKPRKIRTNTLDPETRKKLAHIGGVPADAWSRRSGQDSLESSRHSGGDVTLAADNVDLVAQFIDEASIPNLITSEDPHKGTKKMSRKKSSVHSGDVRIFCTSIGGRDLMEMTMRPEEINVTTTERDAGLSESET